ncbi:hypothetical protein ACI78M_04545 [Leuconostoc mesenteroides]|uniref:hypothetical protein n=1 Tax=Leuconostoc mesenteroides TaxID=1245 RepID=UPI003858C56C
MKKSNAHNKFLWERRPISRLQQTLAGLVVSLPMWLPTVVSADIGDAAKTSGSKVITILYIVLIVVGAICLLLVSSCVLLVMNRWRKRVTVS